MSMSKGNGWADYFCKKCGALAGHYYVGLQPTKEKKTEMEKRTKGKFTCYKCMSEEEK